MNTTKVAIIISFVALSIATNYALVGLPNLKVMDFIVFIGGFCFGPVVGALIAVLTWAVYGVINPYGFVLPVWLATMFSESIYGVVGGLLGKNLASINLEDQRLRSGLLFGSLGFILTLIYDLITNIVYASTFGLPIIVSIILGVPFTALHELSNVAIFSIGSTPLIRAVRKISVGDRIGFVSTK
ncbi:MAG: hypothetical protein ACETVR_01540 [Candidatus Bathyarchaeia archaeon]